VGEDDEEVGPIGR
jgi:hypothetical protein